MTTPRFPRSRAPARSRHLRRKSRLERGFDKMKIAIIGQQDFGKAVFEAFLAKGDTVAGVFCAPEKEGGKPDPLKVAASEKGLQVFQFASLKAAEATAAMQGLAAAGKHKETVQDESHASYEGWCRANEARINWNNHVDFIHNTIRGCDPAPGAWTTIGGRKLQLFGSRKHLVRTFGAVKGKIGEITDIGAESMRITAQGGQIEVGKVKAEDTKKIAAAQW